MSDDKVVGFGGYGQSRHREIVSRNRAVKLGRSRHKRQLYVIPTPGKTGWSKAIVFK